MIESEKLKFKIEYKVYTIDRIPEASIYIDNIKKVDMDCTKKILQTVEFDHNCTFNENHNFTIKFSSTGQDNFIQLNEIYIDGINSREVINAYRTFTTEDNIISYPSVNSNIGFGQINIPGMWNFCFYSPFYKFLINWVKDEHYAFYNSQNINYIT